jgi:hypothetical protein
VIDLSEEITTINVNGILRVHLDKLDVKTDEHKKVVEIT